MKFKKLLSLVLVGAMACSLAACGGNNKAGASENKEATVKKKEDVELSIWVSKEQQKMIKTMCDEFAEAHKDEVNLEVELGIQSEEEARDAVLTDVKAAADIYSMANDQVGTFVASDALAEVKKEDFPEIFSRNTPISLETGTVEGKLYGFPRTADNGYFLYYNKNYLTEADVASWDTMLAKAAKVGKKVSMHMNSGWYLWSFYRAAGLTTTVDTAGNTQCNWNQKGDKYTGLQVTQAILNICKNPAFVCADSPAFEVGVEDGTLIAGVCGAWNSEKVKKAWGDGYAATKLPTYTIGNEQIQMYSVTGSKLMGVNKHSKHLDWALKLADWLTNEQNQITCFKEVGSGPSNIKALESPEVKANAALMAYNQQQQWAEVQQAGANYWVPTESFGLTLAEGNKENKDLQQLLESTVKLVNQPVK